MRISRKISMHQFYIQFILDLKPTSIYHIKLLGMVIFAIVSTITIYTQASQILNEPDFDKYPTINHQNTIKKGNPINGKIKSEPCSACHNFSGISSIPLYPHLSAQHASYLVKQIQDIKIGNRIIPEMALTVKDLSEQDILDISAYYSSLPGPKGSTKKELFSLGKSLYRTGHKGKKIPGCNGCHNLKGNGNALANYPKVSGQSVQYLVKQLEDFRNGKRNNDGNSNVMRSIAAKLSDKEIQALASYMSGLRDQPIPNVQSKTP